MKSSHFRFIKLWTTFIVTGSIISCSSVFNPATSFKPKTVVFAILHSYDSTQYVRVYENYQVENFNIATHFNDTQVKNAQVTLSTASSSPVVFSDTLLKRTSTERYTDSIVAYYSKSVNYQFDTGYRLSVINPRLGEVHADLFTPGVGTIDDLSGFLIRNPDQAGVGEHISIRLLLPSPHSSGYLLRMFVEFRIDTLPQTVERRWEVPVQITSSGELVYPTLRENSHAFNGNTEDFAVEAYQATRWDILSKVYRI